MSKMPIAFAAIAISALAALPATAGAVEQSADGIRNVERSAVRQQHKVRHVRQVARPLAPRVTDEGYRESYGYATEPQYGTGTYNGVNRWGAAPGSIW